MSTEFFDHPILNSPYEEPKRHWALTSDGQPTQFIDEIVPLQERLQEVGDDADLKFTYETERHLLYVACTRARDELLVTAVAPESEFLVDIQKR